MADRRGRRPRPPSRQWGPPSRQQGHPGRPGASGEDHPFEAEQWRPYDWDEIVDVVCAGSETTATAAALASVRAGLSVRLTGRAEVFDEQTQDYLDSVTDDLGDPGAVTGPQLPVRLVQGSIGGRPENTSAVATFVGASLRSWAAQCVATPGGMLCTAVADPRMTTRYTAFGQVVEAVVVGDLTFGSALPPLADWLDDEATEHGVPALVGTLQSLVFDDGRVAGAILQTPDGPRAVRARYGVALTLVGAEPSWPTDGIDVDAPAQLAFVTRAASRFARLELLVRSA
jgi:hypothetical protein